MDPIKPPGDIIPAAYRQQAASWSEDVHGALRASARRAWWVAGVAAILVVLQTLALVLLLPLKTVVPYTILVDRQTGHAELARGVNLGPMSENEALLQSALAQYVIARETLDASDLAANYKKVGLWSKGVALQDYLKGMDRSNPASILNSANVDTQIATTIKSITPLDKGSALVRFATDRREAGGPAARRDWAAVIRYGYSGAPLSAEDRLINPLGFQVTHYRRDAETAPPPAGASPNQTPDMVQ
jgi:type IV secretion system protein VirB8